MKTAKKNPHIGSNVDDFFAKEGLLEEIEAIAIKRVIALELQDALDKTHMTKTELARRLETSRSLIKAAALLGKRLHVSLQAA
jgi:antitoxin HicB